MPRVVPEPGTCSAAAGSRSRAQWRGRPEHSRLLPWDAGRRGFRASGAGAELQPLALLVGRKLVRCSRA